MKYIYYSFSFTKLQKSKEKSLNLKSYINRIFTPESITLHENYDAKIMLRKALPSVLLHKSEVTYRDTGVSKNVLMDIFCPCFTYKVIFTLK
jgi:hypothetical protein